jgi:hypothetical protein
MAIAAVGEILRPRRLLADHGPLATIRLVAPHAGLVAVQQIGQHRAVEGIGGAATIAWISLVRLSTPKCAFAEPLIALFRLMHLGSTGLVCILGRGRRGDDRRVKNCAGDHLQSLRSHVPLHLIEQPLAQIMRFPNRPAGAVITAGSHRTRDCQPSALPNYCGKLSQISRLG